MRHQKHIQRRSTPKVKRGKVQRKNRNRDYRDHLLINRQRPSPGYVHVTTRRELATFVDIIPNWSELSIGLIELLLAEGQENVMGWQNHGVIALCAWEKTLSLDAEKGFMDDHWALLERLGVPLEDLGDDRWCCHFTRKTARAFQCLHIFLHELGHHRDRMTTNDGDIARGEDFAEAFAYEQEALVFDRYVEVFGL